MLIPNMSKAQSVDKRNSLKIYPLSILGGFNFFSIERTLIKKITGQVGVGFSSITVMGDKYSTVGMEFQGRYYLKEALKGLYGGGQFGFGKGQVSTSYLFLDNSTSTEVNYGTLRYGAKVGYQWLLKSGFTLDLNLGYGYRSYKYKALTDMNGNVVYNNFNILRSSGYLPSFGFALGYSF